MSRNKCAICDCELTHAERKVGACTIHQKLFEAGYIAIIEIEDDDYEHEEKVSNSNIKRTGEYFHMEIEDAEILLGRDLGKLTSIVMPIPTYQDCLEAYARANKEEVKH